MEQMMRQVGKPLIRSELGVSVSALYSVGSKRFRYGTGFAIAKAGYSRMEHPTAGAIEGSHGR